MTPITCSTCAWFVPDDIDTGKGLGLCMHEACQGYWHALAPHRCRGYESTEDETDAAA